MASHKKFAIGSIRRKVQKTPSEEEAEELEEQRKEEARLSKLRPEDHKDVLVKDTLTPLRDILIGDILKVERVGGKFNEREMSLLRQVK